MRVLSVLDIDGARGAFPPIADRLDAIDRTLAAPVKACAHLTGRAPFHMAFACAAHLDHIGLLCHRCIRRHTIRHGNEFEWSCDACPRVCWGDEQIGGLTLAVWPNNYRLRRNGQTRRVRLFVFIGSLGLCEQCVDAVDDLVTTHPWSA